MVSGIAVFGDRHRHVVLPLAAGGRGGLDRFVRGDSAPLGDVAARLRADRRLAVLALAADHRAAGDRGHDAVWANSGTDDADDTRPALGPSAQPDAAARTWANLRLQGSCRHNGYGSV